MKIKQESLIEKNKLKSDNQDSRAYRALTYCPYCNGKLIKKGKRKKKYEIIQLYYCKNCGKKITPIITKYKTYPLKIIMDSISLFNRLNSLDKIPDMIKEKYGIEISSRIIVEWLKEYKKYAPFFRMREFASKKYSKEELIEEAKLIHQQIYDFKYHKAKLNFILNEEFRHFKFKPLQEFLELVDVECPHQIFQDSTIRISEFKNIFNLNEVKIVSKDNKAIKIANFVMQAIVNNKARHKILQDFMLVNDTVTVAVEVPVLLNNDDIRHYKHELNFNVPINIKDEEYITGHIDLLQVRNGIVHIIDFKPSASKAKPMAQLTLYALALSRLTGIRLYHLKCAWFDNKNYYEFFPLHVVYKLKRKKIDKAQQKLIQE